MIENIDRDVLHRAADTMAENLPPGEIIVHTVTITVNGAHGGVDVIAELFESDGPDRKYTWRST